MSKRTTISNNLRSLTGRKDVGAAMKGWKVVHLVSPATNSRPTACELCGTRFQNGAIIRYSRPRQTISIGGDCLATILRGRFSVAKASSYVLSRLESLLAASYEQRLGTCWAGST